MGTCIAIGDILNDRGIGVLVLARVLTSLHDVQNGSGSHSTSCPCGAQATRLKFVANKLRNLARWAEHSLITDLSLIAFTGRSLSLLPLGKHGWVTGSYTLY